MRQQGGGEEAAQGGGADGACGGAAVGGGWGRSARRGACLGFGLGPVRGRARRGREEGEAW